MKKSYFVLGAVIAILFAVLSLFLSYQFEEQANQEFLLTACGFGIAAFFFFDAKNAEKPIKDFGLVRNTLKQTLQSHGKLNMYKSFSYAFLILFVYLGITQLADGVLKVIKSIV